MQVQLVELQNQRVAPVLADWRRYSFSRTYEVPRQLNARLEQIAEQYETLVLRRCCCRPSLRPPSSR